MNLFALYRARFRGRCHFIKQHVASCSTWPSVISSLPTPLRGVCTISWSAVNISDNKKLNKKLPFQGKQVYPGTDTITDVFTRNSDPGSQGKGIFLHFYC